MQGVNTSKDLNFKLMLDHRASLHDPRRYKRLVNYLIVI